MVDVPINVTRQTLPHAMAHGYGSALAPIAALLLSTAVFLLTDVDMVIARWLYDVDHQCWIGVDSTFCYVVYHYFTLPGLAIGIGGAVVALLAPLLPQLRPCRSAGIFCALMLALGPGLLVNGICKPVWLRPRPKQLVEFGGDSHFLPVGVFGDNSQTKSFPCGHASMGFLLMAPGFLLFRRRRLMSLSFFAAGMVLGTILGAVRMAQGGHFASDVVWSAGLVYLTGLGLMLAAPAMHRIPGIVWRPAAVVCRTARSDFVANRMTLTPTPAGDET